MKLYKLCSCCLILPHLRSHHCSDASFQRLHQYDLPASSGWRLCRQQTSVTSSTPQRRVTGTSSASLTCSWAASQKPSLCSWKPKAPPSLALQAWPLAKGWPLSLYPWSSTPGELVPAKKKLWNKFAYIQLVVKFSFLWFLYILPPFCHVQLHPQRGEPLVDERLHSSSDSRDHH